MKRNREESQEENGDDDTFYIDIHFFIDLFIYF